ncbi:class IV adenylate cyclase [Leptolinea tardivitalis]|uniref:class IV adenylate cyclase n=1 Tax=Leptolinea tardivitalis TaxID=229920 RepID=UPI0007859AF8|nr:class IV adenylate cyclase [Leptolinea tardivitalis]GAP21341.1 adenylyl cyclase CyaB, putative [Leptolinea tardivitalis]
MTENEIEVKFLIKDLPRLELRIKALGGKLIQPREKETNFRFDTPDGTLTRNHQVLRLRQDQKAHLTYKGAAEMNHTVSVRREIEVEVSSFDDTRQLLEALGYEPFMLYEKYRTTYSLGESLVTLDELPFGHFSEIEGPSATRLQETADSLWLDWPLRSMESYSALFERVKTNCGWTMKNLSFDEFIGKTVTPADLGLKFADRTE